jgi:hypothetical protein
MIIKDLMSRSRDTFTWLQKVHWKNHKFCKLRKKKLNNSKLQIIVRYLF